MSDSSATKRLIFSLTALAAVVWTLVVGGSLVWNVRYAEQQTMDLARAEATANLNKDLTFRRWATEHGGVYVPLTDKQPSVPWLDHVPGRDVVTTDGRAMTLLNPASMLRQIMDRYAKDYGIRGRITGLKYLNPDNAPDVWEKQQLQDFIRGDKKEVWAVADLAGQPHLRHLRAMFMEPGCEKCHAILGYKLGDMRGATGINLPLAPYYQQTEKASRNTALSHGAIWLLGLLGIGGSAGAINRSERKRQQEEAERDRAELRYRTLFEQSRDGIVTIDPRSARFVSFNTAAHEQLGYSREEFAGMGVADIEAKESPTELALHGKAIRNSGWDSFETRHRHKDGSIRDVEIVVQSMVIDARPTLHCSIRDITERKQAEDNLRIAAAAFDSQEGMMVTDAQGVILRINRAFSATTGYEAADVIGQTPRLLQSGRHDAEFYRQMWDSINRTDGWQGEVWDRRKDGEVYPKWLTISAVKNVDGVVTNYIGTHYDITERKKAEEKINDLAFFDQLTGLPNRTLLLDRLKQTMTAGQRNGAHSALLFIDMDNFKTLNDTLGHDMGDLMLMQAAQRLTQCVREGDTVARLSGDEFMVLLANLSASEREAATGTEAVAKKILAMLKEPYPLGPLTHHSTASIGATLFRGHLASPEDLMKQADLAMYKSKEAGRNAWHFFDPQMELAVKQRATLEADLRHAIAENQFLLHYQPQVADGGRLTGAEALIRWQHPQRGMVSPAEFIPLAEETGLILPLGGWVMHAACAQLTLWAARTETADLTLAVNVSAHQFRQADFVEQVLTVLKSSGANPQRLKLELTESLLVDNIEDVIEKMFALKAKGIGFALDDFGTGYSSLAYLKRLPLDQLKIDQSFVRDVLIDPNDAAIARTVVALAQSLGLGVIAEGVETAEQRDFLAASGCHAYQGYFFSRPLSIEHFEKFARREPA